MKKIAGILLLSAVALIFSGFIDSQVVALQVEKACGDVDIIFARGSGQGLEAGESKRFRDQIEDRLGTAVGVNYYELGTEKYGNNQYLATTVNDWYKNGNIIGAKLSSGYANDYGKSVDSGVSELQSYLIQRTEKCPSERVILGGYSQGAQVMGQALPSLLPAQLSKIDFVALFGDPKLYLPEGEGALPDACKGKNFSDWRRIIGDCHTDNGSLGARKPYIPAALSGKVGLWCHEHDFICGSSKILGDDAGHGEYKSDGDSIDSAAQEIASKLKKTLPQENSATIDDQSHPQTVNLTSFDVVFVVNRSSVSSARLEEYKNIVRSSAAMMRLQGGRVGFASFMGEGSASDGVYSAEATYNAPLGASETYFSSQLSALELYQRQPGLEPILWAMKYVLQTSDWKPGASKALVLLTDSPIYDPNSYLVTIEEVAKLAREIDPVMIYPIISGAPQAATQELADATGGKIIDTQSGIATTLFKEITVANQPPIVKLSSPNYVASIGDEIMFDASQSTVMNSTIAKYEWDFDGDGAYDQTTETPTVSHIYPTIFDSSMRVRVTADNATTATQSAIVQIGVNEQSDTPQAPTDVKATILSTKNNLSTVELSWKPTDTLAASWVMSVDGVELGMIAGGRTSIQITDVDRSRDVEMSIAGLSVKQVLGAASTVSIAKVATSPAPPKTSSFFDKLFGWLRVIIISLFKHAIINT